MLSQYYYYYYDIAPYSAHFTYTRAQSVFLKRVVSTSIICRYQCLWTLPYFYGNNQKDIIFQFGRIFFERTLLGIWAKICVLEIRLKFYRCWTFPNVSCTINTCNVPMTVLNKIFFNCK